MAHNDQTASPSSYPVAGQPSTPVTDWAPLLQPLARATALLSLVLSKNDITALPDCLGHLSSLHTLDVSGNRLAALPDIGRLTRLRRLDASSNRIT